MRLLGSILLALAAVIFILPFLVGPIDVRVPEERVRAEIDAALPFDTAQAGVDVTVTHATADFQADNRVAVTLEGTASGLGLTGAFSGATITGLEYRGGAFYLADITLDDLEISPDGDSSAMVDSVRTVGAALWDRAADQLAPSEATSPDAPSADDTKGGMDDLGGRLVDQARAAARRAGNSLARSIPVYELESLGVWGQVAGLSLREVRFEETAAVAVLDPRMLVVHILGGLLVLAGSLAVAVGLLRAPSS